MKNNTLKKLLAGSAMAVMVLPMAASAHGLGLNLDGDLDLGAGGEKEKTHLEGNGTFNMNANAKVGDRDNDNDKDGDKEHRKEIKASKNASTTAAVVTKKANRVKDVADFMGSIGASIESKLAGLGTTTPAVATATVDYKTQLAGAKSQAQAAINTAATVAVGNSTTTNASIVAQAQVSLKAAQDFLAAARADLKLMLSFLWQSK